MDKSNAELKRDDFLLLFATLIKEGIITEDELKQWIDKES